MAIFINFAVYENDSISIHLDSDNKGISSGLKYFSIHSDFGYMENTVKCNRYILDNTIMIDNENEASYKDQLKDALTKLFNDIYFKNMWMVERCAKWFIDAYSDACMNKFNVYESDIGRLDIHMVNEKIYKPSTIVYVTKDWEVYGLRALIVDFQDISSISGDIIQSDGSSYSDYIENKYIFESKEEALFQIEKEKDEKVKEYSEKIKTLQDTVATIQFKSNVEMS